MPANCPWRDRRPSTTIGPVPLIEIVSEPDLVPGEPPLPEQLKSILQYAEVSDCKMEEACAAARIAAPEGEHRVRQQGRAEEHELL